MHACKIVNHTNTLTQQNESSSSLVYLLKLMIVREARGHQRQGSEDLILAIVRPKENHS
jgi:hypothetical protein